MAGGGVVALRARVAGNADAVEEGFEERPEGRDRGGGYADAGFDGGPDGYVEGRPCRG